MEFEKENEQPLRRVIALPNLAPMGLIANAAQSAYELPKRDRVTIQKHLNVMKGKWREKDERDVEGMVSAAEM